MAKILLQSDNQVYKTISYKKESGYPDNSKEIIYNIADFEFAVDDAFRNTDFTLYDFIYDLFYNGVCKTLRAFSLKSEKSSSMESESLSVASKSDISLNADNSTTIMVGNTLVDISSSSITMKAGGVEVLIDSNGLVVKGGEIKSE